MILFHLALFQPSEIEMESQVHLYGHTAEITSLFVCKPYSIMISVSKDGTCIIWDLNRYEYICNWQHFKYLFSNVLISLHFNVNWVYFMHIFHVKANLLFFYMKYAGILEWKWKITLCRVFVEMNVLNVEKVLQKWFNLNFRFFALYFF